MNYRPYPNLDRARRYALYHGRRTSAVSLAEYTIMGDFPEAVQERIRQIIATMPNETIQFTGWFR